MHIILGATGHVGTEVANALLKRGHEVMIITRDRDKSNQWKQRDAEQ
jgi:uncharacterized protein YbjT (DUF2867 family)